jgi:hypothetical protein
MAALIPALLLALFATWSGTFATGASALANGVGYLALLAVVAWAAARLSPARLADPLALGWPRATLAWAVLVAVLASWLASPVPRAGRTVVLLLPVFLLLPAALAACWPDDASRRRGRVAVCLALALVATWAIVDWLLVGAARPAVPLGHHNLLALWLLLLLPLAAGVARDGPGRDRAVGAAALTLGLVALFASRSLAGLLGLSLEALLASSALVASTPPHRGRRRALLGVGAGLLLLGALALPRLTAVTAGHDPSAAARVTYLAAGWRGVLARPRLGWGPGSTPWTLALHQTPQPAVNPPGEVVGDLHSLPLALAYELGLGGGLLALAIAGCLVWRGGRLDAGRIGLAGFLLAGLAGAPLAVTALPVALAVAVAGSLANLPTAVNRPRGRRPALAALLAAAALAAALAPGLVAARLAEAASTTPGRSRAALGRAVGLDPHFPLYAARCALAPSLDDASEASTQRVTSALAAARGARGVAAFWLLAGRLAVEADDPRAGDLLDEACRLDPLGALAPYLRALGAPADPRASAWVARALAAEPRLLAATAWERWPGLRAAAVDQVGAQEGIDPGWRLALLAANAAIPATPSGETRGLELGVDLSPVNGSEGFALHLFRRLPDPLSLAVVELRLDRLPIVAELPAATTLPTSAAWPWRSGTCELAANEGPRAPR